MRCYILHWLYSFTLSEASPHLGYHPSDIIYLTMLVSPQTLLVHCLIYILAQPSMLPSVYTECELKDIYVTLYYVLVLITHR